MNKIQLRKIAPDDMELLYRWVNDPTVRSNAFKADAVSPEEHRTWFERMMIDPNVDIFILMVDDAPIGQVRLVFDGGQRLIDYSIDAAYRGQGFGKLILKMVEDEIDDGTFVGRVKKTNVASQLIFRALGYKETELDDFFEYVKIINNTGGGSVLFLTNNRNAVPLFRWLQERAEVFVCSSDLNLDMIRRLRPQLVVSYNYKHIVSKEIIDLMDGNIINLHISYLPWNRGCHPNLWSFIDDTPKGVTIHKMAVGLDTGDIICQRHVSFDEQTETLASTYRRLNEEIVDLLKQNWDEIYGGKYTACPQTGNSTYHRQKELMPLLNRKDFSWDMTVREFKSFVAGIKSRGDIH